jgi:hypothetical protein
MAQIRLQFVLGASIPSRLIAWYGEGYGGYSHVDGILSDGRLLGARSDSVGGQPPGTHIRPPDYEKWSKRDVVTLSATDEEYAGWEAAGRAKIGTPYDKGAIFGFLTGNDKHEGGHWICSALQLNSLQHIGRVPFPFPVDAHQVTPNALLLVVAAIGGKW